MKGSMFMVFEDHVSSNYGAEVFEHLLDTVALETTEPFVGPGVYPAGDLVALVVGLADHVGITVDEVLRSYGRHAFAALAGSIAPLMAQFTDPRDFLLSLEGVIHTEVRKLDLHASPARFEVTADGDDGLLLRYQSPLGLFPLVHGLLDGAGDWFGVPFAHELIATEGTNGVFRLRFDPPAGVDASATAASSAASA